MQHSPANASGLSIPAELTDSFAEPLRHFARQQLAGEEYVLLACDELTYWFLLTNVPQTDVAKETLVLWYYYRWNIEDYFKLLKSGGHEMEHWQQESGLAILKRLLVVSMGLSLVWSLRASESPEAKEFKKLLVRLSGKSQQRGKPATAGTLLSGLFVLLMIFDFLEMMDYDVGKINKVRNLLANFLPE